MRMLRDSNCSILTWLNTSIIYEKNDQFVNDALTLGMDYSTLGIDTWSIIIKRTDG
jgi:hypothetical protein